jgi:hypothetical protein
MIFLRDPALGYRLFQRFVIETLRAPWNQSAARGVWG